jgi:hypothetical protein
MGNTRVTHIHTRARTHQIAHLIVPCGAMSCGARTRSQRLNGINGQNGDALCTHCTNLTTKSGNDGAAHVTHVTTASNTLGSATVTTAGDGGEDGRGCDGGRWAGAAGEEDVSGDVNAKVPSISGSARVPPCDMGVPYLCFYAQRRLRGRCSSW